MSILLSIILLIVLYVGLVLLEAAWGMFLFNLIMALFDISFVLTFPQAIAICLFLSFISRFFRTPDTKKEQERIKWELGN